MVAASELGDAAVTVPVILVVLAWLVWQRRLRSAAYWISAVAFAQLFVVTLKFVMRRARPSSMYEGLQGFSFPRQPCDATHAGSAFNVAALIADNGSPQSALEKARDALARVVKGGGCRTFVEPAACDETVELAK